MAQDYVAIDPEDALTIALSTADQNQDVLRSSFSGATAPSNPVTGQLWADTSASPAVVRFWDGVAWSPITSKLTTLTTPVGNVGTGEDDLMTYSVPTSALASNGQALRVKAAGTFAANANNKRIRLRLGASLLLDSTALAINGGSWVLDALIIRTGASSQSFVAEIKTGNALLLNLISAATSAESLASAVTLKLTAEATADNDVVQSLMVVNRE